MNILEHPLLAFIGLFILTGILAEGMEPPDKIINRLEWQLEGDMVIIEETSLLPISPLYFKQPVLASIIEAKRVLTWEEQIEMIWSKYPEMADLLVCIDWNESRGNQLAIGDNGKAFGSFQIWRHLHKLTEDQAFDFEYSLDWTANKIKNGQGKLWTTFQPCLEEIS